VCALGLRFNPPMKSNLSIFIGIRYAFSKRRDGYLSFISGFSFCAMALGVMALIVVLSVMNGFDREIKQRLLNVVPHITVVNAHGYSASEIDQISQQLRAQYPSIKSISPLINNYAMLARQSRQQGVLVQGVDPLWSAVNLLTDHMLIGEVSDLRSGDFGILLGSQAARRLDASIGDKIELILPKISVTPLGAFPRLKMMRVVGIFEVGAQVDASMAFIHQQDARTLLQMGDKFQGMQLQLHNAYAAEAAVEKISAANILTEDNLQWQSWTELMGTLFQAMRMEKVVVGLLLSVIIAVAAFNIIASLLLMVSDKRKDIAVLRTLGARSDQIVKLFMVQGTAVGIVGVAVGMLLGCVIACFIGDMVAAVEALTGSHLFDPSIYMISSLPSRLLFTDVLLVVVSASIISFLATVYPAWRAGQVLPAEALRYDR